MVRLRSTSRARARDTRPAWRLAIALALVAITIGTTAAASRADAAGAATSPRASAGAGAAGRKTAGARAAVAAPAATITAWGPVQLVVYKSKRTLAVYREGNFEKEYPVVLGLVPDGAKRHEGDARTPEGLYHVTARHRHPRWQWFLALDYPNAADRAAWSSAVKKGKIPDEDGSPFGVGGSVGIHGNDRLVVQEAGLDWTKGCIALRANDIVELAAEVPVGTPVWIVQ